MRSKLGMSGVEPQGGFAVVVVWGFFLFCFWFFPVMGDWVEQLLPKVFCLGRLALFWFFD